MNIPSLLPDIGVRFFEPRGFVKDHDYTHGLDDSRPRELPPTRKTVSLTTSTLVMQSATGGSEVVAAVGPSVTIAPLSRRGVSFELGLQAVGGAHGVQVVAGGRGYAGLQIPIVDTGSAGVALRGSTFLLSEGATNNVGMTGEAGMYVKLDALTLGVGVGAQMNDNGLSPMGSLSLSIPITSWVKDPQR